MKLNRLFNSTYLQTVMAFRLQIFRVENLNRLLLRGLISSTRFTKTINFKMPREREYERIELFPLISYIRILSEEKTARNQGGVFSNIYAYAQDMIFYQSYKIYCFTSSDIDFLSLKCLLF